MHIIHSAKPQQQRIKHYVAASDAFSFFNQLTSPELLETMESTLPEHRERLFPPHRNTVYVSRASPKTGSILSKYL